MANTTPYFYGRTRRTLLDVPGTVAAGPYAETDKVVFVEGGLSAENCKIHTDGTGAANASSLATNCARSDVNVINFNKPQGGVYALSGTIDCNGKTLRFFPGCELSGTFTLQNGVIESGFLQKIFPLTVTLVNARTTLSMVSVKWFGAVGSGAVNDKPAIQKAGDVMIANVTLPSNLYFPHGDYRIDSELFYYNWTGTDYAFWSFNLIGQESAYFNDETREARIIATHTDTFAIGVQLARSLRIKGLVIKGPFNPTGGSDWDEYANRSYTTWSSSYGMRDNPTSPLCGISLDPVDNSDTLGSSGRYTRLDDMYRGSGTLVNSGCSGIVIEQCRIRGFTIDIGISLNSITSNCENVHIFDCALEVCKACVAYGQDQTKDNTIDRCITWERTHTLVDTLNYGRGTGQPPYVNTWNVAGEVVQLWQFNPLRAACKWQNVFAESLYRIGDGNGGAGFSLESSTINYNLVKPVGSPNGTVVIPQTHLTGGKIIFKGCVIKYYDNLYNKRMRITGSEYRFDTCELDRVPLFDPMYDYEEIFYAHFLDCISGDGKIGKDTGMGYYPVPLVPICAYGHITFEEGGILQRNDGLRDLKITLDCGWPCKEIKAENVVLTVNATNRTATFSGLASTNVEYQVAVGDYVYSESGTVCYGRVDSINRGAGTGTLVDVPTGAGSGTIHVYFSWVERVAGQFVGDILDGSANITNCEYDMLLEQPFIGQRLKIYRGNLSYQPVIDGIAGTTIVMSQAADFTKAGYFNPWVNIQKSRQQFEITCRSLFGSPTFPVLIPEDAILYTREQWANGAIHTDLKCIKAGFMNAATISKVHQAEYRSISEIQAVTVTSVLGGSFSWLYHIILVDTTDGDVPITLVPVDGWWYVVKKISGDANKVTVEGSGASTIDGDTSRELLTENEFIHVVSTASNLYTA